MPTEWTHGRGSTDSSALECSKTEQVALRRLVLCAVLCLRGPIDGHTPTVQLTLLSLLPWWAVVREQSCSHTVYPIMEREGELSVSNWFWVSSDVSTAHIPKVGRSRNQPSHHRRLIIIASLRSMKTLYFVVKNHRHRECELRCVTIHPIC